MVSLLCVFAENDFFPDEIERNVYSFGMMDFRVLVVGLMVGGGVLQATAARIDLDVQGTATQSSDYGSGQFPASFGIDGNEGNFTHTLNASGSWWMYEFDNPQVVESLEIVNRSSCCGNRLEGLTVRVTNDVGVLVFEEKIGGPQSNGSRWYRSLPPSTMVHSVWIGLPNGDVNGGGNYYITIAELILEDDAADPPPPDETLPYGPIHLLYHGSATQTTTHAGGYIADFAIDGDPNTFTHTVAGATNQFWEYTFSNAWSVGVIEVDNRADCCDARLSGLYIRVYDESDSLIATNQLDNPGLGETWSWILPPDLQVKRVRIGLDAGKTNGDGGTVVTLGEVRMLASANLALNRPAYMVRLQDSLPPPENINDGDRATESRTTTATVDGYFEIDLEDTYAIYSLRAIAATCCSVGISYTRLRLFDENHDSVYWQEVGNSDTDLYDMVLDQPICARYVRIGLENKQRTSGGGGNWYIGLKEFEVYGRPIAEVGLHVFRASTNMVASGQSVNLDWEADDAVPVGIYPGVGFVGTNEVAGVSVSPAVSTSYLMLATNACGVYERGAAVYVDGQPLSIRINEFVADNENSLRDGNNNASDWIELYNPNDFVVDLTGWGLSDDPVNPMKWVFPGSSIPAFGYLIVFASGDSDLYDDAGNLHATWRINDAGEPIQLTRPDGISIEHAVTNVPPQNNDLAYGYDLEGNLTFIDPTPGGANFASSYEGWLQKLDFSHERGFYTNSFDLVITNANSNATVYVSIDGGNPDTEYAAGLGINSTTALRAEVRRANYKSPPIAAHTYIMVEDTIANDMTTSVASDPQYAPALRQAFADIPSVSIMLNDAQPVRDEQGGSFEFIWPDQSEEHIQENCGLSRYGGAYTTFSKQNFRVSFRKEYGRTKLRGPLFNGFDRGIPVVERFDELDLRAGSHDMVARGAYMSNRFIDDTMLDMGNLNPHGRFVHLFINGEYWGQYHLRERMVEAFMADYLGGQKEDYVAVRGNDNVGQNFVPGTPSPTSATHRFAWDRVRGFGGDYASVTPYLNVQSLIDVWLAWNYGNCESEYRAAGPIDGSSGFIFYLADADGFLRNSGNRTGNNGPGSLINTLVAEGHPDFQTLMRDRIFTHFFHDGALTPNALTDRLAERMDEIQNSLVAETARWSFRTPANWLSYIDNLTNGQFQTETSVVVSELRARGLYPADPPTFDVRGGLVTPGHQPGLTTGVGTVYYTLDGSDPRLPGGAISPDALIYSAGSITLAEDTQINVRWHDGGDWSALNSVTFLMNNRVAASAANTLLTELSYNPDGSDEYEFIEIRNISTNLVDYTGVTLSNAVEYTFPENYVLSSGQVGLVVEDVLAFEERYQNPTSDYYYAGIEVVGQWSGQLDNTEEMVALVSSNGVSISTFTYATSNGWPKAADGGGFSLELRNEASAPGIQNARDVFLSDPQNWRASCYFHGTPGRSVYCPEFFGIEMQGGDMSFETVPGETYEVDYSNGLLPLQWQLLERIESAPSDFHQIVDPQAYNVPQRVYRIRWLQ